MKREIKKARKRKRWTLGSACDYARMHVGDNPEGAVRLTAWAVRRLAGYTIRTREGRERLDTNVRGGRYPSPSRPPGSFFLYQEIKRMRTDPLGVERVPELIRTDGVKVRP